MKNTLKVTIIVLILVVISVILFITGKRHDILLENNSSTGIKYSINGEPYKTLDIGKKAEGIKYLKAEIALYPESATYVSRIIKQLEK